MGPKGYVRRGALGAVLTGTPRPTTTREGRRSRWVSFSSAPARLTCSPSIPPSRPSRSASVMWATGLSRISTSRQAGRGPARASGSEHRRVRGCRGCRTHGHMLRLRPCTARSGRGTPVIPTGSRTSVPSPLATTSGPTSSTAPSPLLRSGFGSDPERVQPSPGEAREKAHSATSRATG